VAWLLGRSGKRAAVGELTGRLEGERVRGEELAGESGAVFGVGEEHVSSSAGECEG